MTQPVQTERSIGQLVADTKGDVTDVVRTTVDLGKAEVGRDVKVIGLAVGLWAAAGFLALYAFGFLLSTLARVIAIWLPEWAGFAIVTGFLFLVIAILALVGLRSFKKKHGKPVATIAHVQESIAVLKGAFSKPATDDDAAADPKTTTAKPAA